MDSEKDTYDNDNTCANDTSSGDEDFAIGVDIANSKEAHGEREQYQYEVLTTDEVVKHMVDCINEVNCIIHLPQTVTGILLNHFNWDKEKFMERYYDGNEDRFFREAHVINPSNRPALLNIPKVTVAGVEKCEICFASFSPSNMTGIECGHRFCGQCWADYLTNKIMKEGLAQSIPCAAYGCDILVDYATVMKLVSDSKVKMKYQHLITNSFVDCNRLFRWCPSVDCTYAIKVIYVDACPVVCKCGHTFCFACGDKWHDPVNCRLLKKWLKKCEDDSETSNWLAAYTKNCPKCNIQIEKSGGCNHMVCKNQNCHYDFCWVCLGPWKQHGSSWYSCNRYEGNKGRSARDAQEKYRASLLRYLHYYNRYNVHIQSMKLENNLYSSAKQKMEEMLQHNMSWIDVQFLKKALDILCQCRRTLMYTYVFAYYSEKNNQLLIFEDNQKDLETATEQLSEYMEQIILSQCLFDIKQAVQDKCKYCERRRKVLIDHVHKGYEKNWWNYIE